MLIDRTYIISYFLTAGLLKRFINQKKLFAQAQKYK